MSDLKSFSVGHTAKGAIWWQAWPFDGEPRKGTADTIGGALVEIGVDPAHWRREEIAGGAKSALALAEIELTALRDKCARLEATIATMESLLPDSTDPAPQAADRIAALEADLARANEELCRLALFTAPSADCDEWRARAVDAGKDVADLRVKLANAQDDEKKAQGEAVAAFSAVAALQAENDTLKADLSDLRKQVGADRLERWGVANG